MSTTGFDLTQLETTTPSDRPAKMEVHHPVSDEVLTFVDATGVTRPVVIFLHGAESTIARNKRRELQRNRFGKLMRGKMKVTPEQVEAEQNDMFASLTSGWEGIAWKGQELPFSLSNARMLYAEMSWVRNQVDDFINELGNYLGNSSSGSSDTPSNSSASTSA